MLNLGTQTGSLTNHLQSRMVKGAPDPKIGDGATTLHWTDRHAATVIGWDGQTLTVQRDKATRTDSNGMSEQQEYSYEPDPQGAIYTYRRDKAGFWKLGRLNAETKRWNQTSGPGVLVGQRNEYHDFSF